MSKPDTEMSIRRGVEIAELVARGPAMGLLGILMALVKQVIDDMAWAVNHGLVTPQGVVLPRMTEVSWKAVTGSFVPSMEEVVTACEFVRGGGASTLEWICEGAKADVLCMPGVIRRIMNRADEMKRSGTLMRLLPPTREKGAMTFAKHMRDAAA